MIDVSLAHIGTPHGMTVRGDVVKVYFGGRQAGSNYKQPSDYTPTKILKTACFFMSRVLHLNQNDSNTIYIEEGYTYRGHSTANDMQVEHIGIITPEDIRAGTDLEKGTQVDKEKEAHRIIGGLFIC